MYQSDILTISANLGGVPAVSIPVGTDQQGLPVGVQLTTKHFEENLLLRIASSIVSLPEFKMKYGIK